MLAQERANAPQLPARLAIAGVETHALAQLGHALVGAAAAEARNLEVAPRHLHAGVELDGAHERCHRLLVQTGVVVQHAEIVVRTRIRGIDTARERSQEPEIARARGGSWQAHWRRTPITSPVFCGA